MDKVFIVTVKQDYIFELTNVNSDYNVKDEKLSLEDAKKNLQRGIYIINGSKILIE
mgnify:CR=1 FL=1